MKLVTYRRVSSKGQAKDGYGLQVQATDTKAWAKDAGHQIVADYSDDGVSGCLGADVVEGVGTNGEHLADRPGLQEAIRMIQDGEAAGLLVGKLDRLGRATHVQEAVLAMVWRAGGTVYAADQGEIKRDDPDDPMRTAMRKIMAVFDELDKAIAVQRMRKGREAKAAEGRHAVGVYPYGYQAGGEGRERDAVPNQAEQQVIALILSHRAAGKSYREIIEVLDDAHIPPRSGGTWYPSAVRKIVQRAGLS